ncbi:hypothetical protein ACFRNJ_39060 [Streptomyces sp. NPDC056721]|uniref:hypothetical protein n=1 Tax=Streptomyces sp. NPDC056721 TaxID=3345923 RepID=UPI0036BC7DD4
MYRHFPHAAAGLLLLALVSPGHVAQAATDGPSGPTVTRIVTLDSAPAAQQVRPGERAAERGAVDDAQDALVDRARDAGLAVAMRRRIRNVVDAVVVRNARQLGQPGHLIGGHADGRTLREVRADVDRRTETRQLVMKFNRAANGASSLPAGRGPCVGGRRGSGATAADVATAAVRRVSFHAHWGCRHADAVGRHPDDERSPRGTESRRREGAAE